MAHDKTTNQPNDTDDRDLEDHDVQDIIPENEEYYTLDLKRDFDGLEKDEEEAMDVAGDNPLNEEEDGADLVQPGEPDYQPPTSNEGGFVDEGDTVDEDNEQGIEVGDPGHWGIDEDTS